MKTTFPLAIASVLSGISLQVYAADTTNGTILGFDRKAGLLVLQDRSIWSLDLMQSPANPNLKAGDRVQIIYESGEDGIEKINSIELLPPAKETTGGADISEVTIAAFDRKKNLLVAADRTVWSLDLLKNSVPTGLKSGDRIRIEYESDEEGVSSIHSIEVITK